VERVLDTGVGPVLGDPTRLQQVVWNLLNNAVKFTKEGKIQVALRRVGSHAEISVSDTGDGIHAEFVPFVFERFRQADATTTRRHGGLGIGLSLVKQITEMHGGTVRAASAGVGQGAAFVVTLPLSIARVTATSPAAGGDPAAAGPAICERVDLRGVKVLVVDDDPDARTIARRILESCHAEVITAGSAREGFELFTEHRPDVVVSDVSMPRDDGYEFIRWVRRLAPGQGGQVPAAALTAFARSEDRRRTLTAGYQTHVVKPVRPDELISVVASLAGRAGIPGAPT
jgi:CheY-like chemotaxis protein